MKFNLKKLVVALALTASAGQASAMTVAGSGDGSLFLTVWDPVAQVTYARDLGTTLSGFLPNSLGGNETPNAGLTQTFTSDPLFASTFAGSVASNIQWNVTAGDYLLLPPQTSTTSGAYQLLTTATSSSGFSLSNAGVGGALNNMNIYQGWLNSVGCGSASSCATSDPTSNAQGGGQYWGSSFGGQGTVGNAGTGFGGSLYFYYVTANGTGFLAAPKTIYQNAQGLGTFSLADNGTLTYSIAAPAAVPVPAAVWLFGSGLLGLVGISRRKKQA